MFYEVITLRRNGEPLRHQEWPEPEFGYITMRTWRPGQTSMIRTAKVATLYTNSGSMQRPALILIEPKIAHLPIDGEVWEGAQLHNSDQGTVEIPQAWLVRPRGKDSQPLQRFDVKRWMAYRRSSGDLPKIPVGKGWLKPERRYG